MNTAIIGLGSNIAPQDNIARAKQLLATEFTLVKASGFVTTKPIGYTDQGDFVNGSVHIETDLAFDDLKSRLKELERQLGRTASTIKSGPRSIDLDIVVFNGRVTDPDFYERDFLKKSVLELLPKLKY